MVLEPCMQTTLDMTPQVNLASSYSLYLQLYLITMKFFVLSFDIHLTGKGLSSFQLLKEETSISVITAYNDLRVCGSISIEYFSLMTIIVRHYIL